MTLFSADNRRKSSGRDLVEAAVSDLLRILLVEDNPGDADLIKELMPGEGPIVFEIECAPRLAVALERVRADPFEIVLLDLGLPDSAGLDTLRSVRQANSDMAIVVLTGNDDVQMGLAAIQEGAQDYLVKGQIDGHLLTRSIRYAIERKKAEERLIQQTEELRQRNDELARLYRASGSLHSSTASNLQGLAKTIVDVVRQEFGQANCSLIMIQKDSNELVRLAVGVPYAD